MSPGAGGPRLIVTTDPVPGPSIDVQAVADGGADIVRSRCVATSLELLVVSLLTACASGSSTGAGIASAEAPRPHSGHDGATGALPHTNPAAQARRPPPCRTRELRARFLAGGYGTGDDFGSIAIWNPGPASCRLTGAVTFTAFFADGSTDPTAGTVQHVPRLVVVLPVHAIRPRTADLPGYLTAFLVGFERDDPSQPNGLCRAQDELTPAILVPSIGRVPVYVRNQDQAARASRGISRAVYGCHGHVVLADVAGPGQ